MVLRRGDEREIGGWHFDSVKVTAKSNLEILTIYVRGLFFLVNTAGESQRVQNLSTENDIVSKLEHVMRKKKNSKAICGECTQYNKGEMEREKGAKWRWRTAMGDLARTEEWGATHYRELVERA